MEKNTNSKERGITLIALVITVIILIILATVTLNVVLGEGGLIEKAQLAKDMTLNATAKEEEGLAKLEEEFANIMSEESIKNYEIVIGEESIIYDGEEQKPAIILKEGETVIPEEEYTVEYTNNINAGTGKITVTINSSGQTVEKEFTIEKRDITFILDNMVMLEGQYSSMEELEKFVQTTGINYKKDETQGLINPTDIENIKRVLFHEGNPITNINQVHVGDYEIRLEYTPNNNYNLTIIPGSLNVMPSPTPGGTPTTGEN